VQRQVYAVLLSSSLALAVAVYLRPGLAEDLHNLVSSRLPTSVLPQASSSPSYGTGYGVAGGTVHQPVPTSRPQSWPASPPSPAYSRMSGQPVTAAQQPAAQTPYRPADPARGGDRRNHQQDLGGGPPQYGPALSAGGPPGAGKIVPCEGARILARVGPHVILASDVNGPVDAILQRYEGRMSARQLKATRRTLLRQALEQQIENKLVYCDARRTIPEEGFPQIEARLVEQFEKVEVQNMMKRTGAGSRRELDEKLTGLGSSLERERKRFVEEVLVAQWKRQQTESNEEITHDQMLAYYRQNLADYEHPAQARWEQITVRVARHASKAAARAALIRSGNRLLDGVPFATVARQSSDGSTASSGGLRDWTTKGSLRSQKLDRAIFGLPVGQLSPILDDGQELHIIRVVERKEAGRTPFEQTQAEIRKKLRQQQAEKKKQQYLARLKEQIPVWTVFDEQPAAADRRGRSAGPDPTSRAAMPRR